MFGHTEVAVWLSYWWASLCKGDEDEKKRRRVYNLIMTFLLNSIIDPDDYVCHSYSYGLRAIIQCLPAWFRFVQCLRRYRDTKRAFPHLVNAGKYSTTFFVVTFAALYATHRGKTNICALKYLFYVSSTSCFRFDLSMLRCIVCQLQCCKIQLRGHRSQSV